jgi:hypothetical protein
MANVHGRVQVCASSNVTDHSTVSGPSGVKRSVIRNWSLDPRYGILSVKFVVSTSLTPIDPRNGQEGTPVKVADP